MPVLVFALAIHTLTWDDLTPAAQRLAAELSLTRDNFAPEIAAIRARNASRLREGEIDHMIFYMLQATDFTAEAPIDPALAATDARFAPGIGRRLSDFARVLQSPSDERQKYFATLLPGEGKLFLNTELVRVLRWISEKEVGCRAAPSPQACIASLYVTRGHSSDTSPQSNMPVRSAFDWLRDKAPFEPKRVLIVGPGSDFAPRTALRRGPVATYQPQFLRELTGGAATIDCADLNPRVVRTAAGQCDSAIQLDVAAESLDTRYDAIVATNVLLYLDRKELFLALQNIAAMLAPAGVLIHNDARFENQVFGRAAGLPVIHFGTVTLDAARRPPLVDRFVIHSFGPRQNLGK